MCRLVLSLLLLAALSVAAGVRVIESTAQRFVFEWWLDSVSVAPAADETGPRSVLRAAGTNVDLGEYGEPVVPGFSFHVGVPWQGNASLSVTPLEVSSIALPSPLALHQDCKGIVRRPGLRFAQAWSSTGQEARLGRLRAMNYILRPFQYDQAARTARVLKRARCEVTLVGAGVSVNPPLKASDYERMLSSLILNYPVAKAWGRQALSRGLKRQLATNFPLSYQGLARFRIGDGHAGFNEATTGENGLVRLSGHDVSAVLGSGLDISRVALYGSYKGELPWALDTVSPPAGVVPIPLMRFDLDGNGRLDDNDYLVAYVTGASDWAFDQARQDFVFGLDRYDDYRTYWLVYQDSASGMQRMAPVAGAPTRTLTHVTSRIMYKRPRQMPSDDRDATIDWVWELLSTGNPSTQPITLNLPGLDPDSAGSVIVDRGSAVGGGDLSVRIGSATPCASCADGQPYPVADWSQPQMSVVFSGSGSADVADVRLSFSRRLDLGGRDSMTIYSPCGAQTLVEYELSGVPGGKRVYIVRIPADERAISLVDTLRDPPGGVYRWTDTAGIGVRYQVSTDAGFQPVPAPVAYTSANVGSMGIRDLHTGGATDYLIVTHGDFLAQANRLAQHKQAMGQFTRPRVVAIEDVYREFSGGNVDPAAVRNFLSYAKRSWPEADGLSYVVLMGKGHYDYKGITTQEPVFIPVAEEPVIGGDYSVPNDREKCSEVFFVEGMGLFLGRLPCATPDEAEVMVDKIVATEDPAQADFGAWRNRVLLIADDDRQGYRPDCIGHVDCSERVAGVILGHAPFVDLHKVYEYEYPGCGVEKPTVRQAILSELNAGVAWVNFFGHGADYIWADERILSTDDIATLTNVKRYPLVASLSCSVGKFDIPDHVSLSEALVRKADGGAIGAISSTRVAYAGENENLARSFYAHAFDTTSSQSLGQSYALALFENGAGPGGYLRAYCYLGDPSIRFVVPGRRVKLSIADASGRVLDTLKALQRVTVRGDIVAAASGSVDAAFGASRPAYVQLSLSNPSYVATRKDGCTDACTGSPSPKYSLPGTPLFTSRAGVHNGHFEQTLLLPKSAVFDRTGVRLIAYAWQDTAQAAGWDTSFIMHGTDTANTSSDHRGPLIGVRPVNADGTQGSASYSDMFTSALPLRCDIVIYDESGVDVVGTGPDEGVTVEIPGVLSKRNMNATFSPREGDFREWVSPFTLSEGQVQPGRYQLIITARDLLENLTKTNIELEVVTSEALRLNHVYNFPNPMRMGGTTRFFYSMPGTEVALQNSLVLRIYTLSGKLIRAVRQPENGWEWDGRDEFGNVLGPNTYLYQMVAWSVQGKTSSTSSPIRKLVIHPPR